MPEPSKAYFWFCKASQDTHFDASNQFRCGVVDSIAQMIITAIGRQYCTYFYIRNDQSVKGSASFKTAVYC